MSKDQPHREQWGSKLGVILAVSGSAVGLGNFLRFPGQAATNGGGAFMIPYFISLILLGIPLCWAEWTLGRQGGRLGFNSAPGVLFALVKNPVLRLFGALAVLIPVAILGIHLSQEQGQEAHRIECKVVRIDNDVQDWTAVGTIALEPLPDELTDEKRARLTAGLPVHLSTDGAEMTRFAFDLVHRGLGKFIITIGVCLFAFSTMISWSYYGEKGAEYLFGPRAILPYKFAFVIFVFLGMVLPKFSAVYDFSDATSGMMVLANIPAILILSPHVLRASRAYFKRLDSGQMPRTR